MASGWRYEYRAHIIEASWFGKPRWRFVVEQKWVHWEHHKLSRRFKSEALARAAAHAWLDMYDEDEKAFV